MTLGQPLLLLLLVPAAFLVALISRRSRPGIAPAALASMGVFAAILALADPSAAGKREDSPLVAVVDASYGIDFDHPSVAATLDRVFARREGPLLVVAFATEATTLVGGENPTLVARDVGAPPTLDRSATNIGAALDHASRIGGAGSHVLLITDGNDNTGGWEAAARRLADRDIPVFISPVQPISSPDEAWVASVRGPTSSPVGAAHTVEVTVGSALSQTVTLVLSRNGDYLGDDSLRLPVGETTFRFAVQADTPGPAVYRAEIVVDGNDDPRNNTAAAVVEITGSPQILYVYDDAATLSSQPEEDPPASNSGTSPATTNDDGGAPGTDRQNTTGQAAQGFMSVSAIEAWRAAEIEVETATAAEIPVDSARLAGYAAVVLDNVAAGSIPLPTMEALERYVRDLGGGLAMIGGDRSFGAGAYYRTPIERALPVDMDVTSSLRVPSLALVFVIDKSGSMAAQEEEGASKLDLVKEAVMAAVEIMNPLYSVGLLAFDADAEWIIPFTAAENRTEIHDRLSRLRSGGGTILSPAVAVAGSALRDQTAAVKHMIILSDGLTSEEQPQSAIAQLAVDGITVTTVSVGTGSDRDLMAEIARIGGGRSYRTNNSREIPRIFVSETAIVSRDLVVNESFFPRPVADHQIMMGVAPPPPLHGFVLTYPKDHATVILEGPESSPILAVGSYGFGNSLAFTSDIGGGWSAGWMEWVGYRPLMAQMIRAIARVDRPGSQELSVVLDERGRMEARVDLVDEGGDFASGLPVRVTSVDPLGQTTETEAEAIGPGAYRAIIRPAGSGVHLVASSAPGYGTARAGIDVPTSREYTPRVTDEDTIREIARVTGGGVLSGADEDGWTRALDTPPALGTETHSLRPYLVLLALLSLIARLVVSARRPRPSASSPEHRGVANDLSAAVRRADQLEREDRSASLDGGFRRDRPARSRSEDSDG